jgi:hypothetical protein
MTQRRDTLYQVAVEQSDTVLDAYASALKVQQKNDKLLAGADANWLRQHRIEQAALVQAEAMEKQMTFYPTTDHSFAMLDSDCWAVDNENGGFKGAIGCFGDLTLPDTREIWERACRILEGRNERLAAWPQFDATPAPTRFAIPKYIYLQGASPLHWHYPAPNRPPDFYIQLRLHILS